MTAFGLPIGQFLFSKLRVYKADKKLMDLAYKGAKEAGFNAVKGRVLSGDQFITDVGKAKNLRKQLKGDCIEMEGAALAHVCTTNKIPFVIIRHICDRADHSARVDADSFCETAARNSYKIIVEMFKSR
jgi:adenosylhomocysteine nucleosidase